MYIPICCYHGEIPIALCTVFVHQSLMIAPCVYFWDSVPEVINDEVVYYEWPVALITWGLLCLSQWPVHKFYKKLMYLIVSTSYYIISTPSLIVYSLLLDFMQPIILHYCMLEACHVLLGSTTHGNNTIRSLIEGRTRNSSVAGQNSCKSYWNTQHLTFSIGGIVQSAHL